MKPRSSRSVLSALALVVGFLAFGADCASGLRVAQLCLAHQMETPSFCSNYIDRVAAVVMLRFAGRGD